MQVEAGMHPPTQHSCALRREEPLVHEEGDDPRAEQLFQRLQAHLRQHVEQAGAQEQPVGDTRRADAGANRAIRQRSGSS